MIEALRIATWVTTPIALAAFIAVLVFAYLNLRAKSRLKSLEALPEEDRLTYAQGEANAFGLDDEALTPDQKYSLMLEITRQRAKNRTQTLKWLSATFVLSLLITVGGQVSATVLNGALPVPTGVDAQAARSTDGSVGLRARYLRETVPEGARASIEFAAELDDEMTIVKSVPDVQRSAQISGDFAEIVLTLSGSAVPAGATLHARLVLTTNEGERKAGEWSRVDLQEPDP